MFYFVLYIQYVAIVGMRTELPCSPTRAWANVGRHAARPWATATCLSTPALHWFLRVAVDQADDFSVSISQTNYIDKMLDKFVPSHKLNAIKHAMPCNPATFAKLTGAKSDEERARMRELPYMQLIGSLLYLSCMSRPDIAFHMSILCSFMFYNLFATSDIIHTFGSWIPLNNPKHGITLKNRLEHDPISRFKDM